MNFLEIMPKDLADELESGHWTKGKGRLKSIVDDSIHHCCFGVMCEMADDIRFSGETALLLDEDGIEIPSSPQVISHVSITEESWIFDARGSTANQSCLIDLNDDYPTWGPVIDKLREIQAELDS